MPVEQRARPGPLAIALAAAALLLCGLAAVYITVARHGVRALERATLTAQALDDERPQMALKLRTSAVLPADVVDARNGTQALQDEQAAAYHALAGQAGRVFAVDPGVRRLRRRTVDWLQRRAQLLAGPVGANTLPDDLALDRARARQRARWHVGLAGLPAVHLGAADASLARFAQLADAPIHVHVVLQQDGNLQIVNTNTGAVVTFGAGSVTDAVLRDGWAAVTTAGEVASVALDTGQSDGGDLSIPEGQVLDAVPSASPDHVWLTGLDRDKQQVSREVDQFGGLVAPALAGERVLADDGTFLVSAALRENVQPTLNLRDRASHVLVRVLGVGTVVAFGKDHILWADGQGTRHLVVSGRDAGDQANGDWVALSPDGTRMALSGPGRSLQFSDATGLHTVALPGVPEGSRAEWVGGNFLVTLRYDGQDVLAVIGVEDGSVHLLRIRDGFQFFGAF